MRRDFGEPDRRFNRLDLTEERPDAAELVMPPVVQESCGLRRHLPLASRQIAPGVDLRANFVDDRGEVVCLLLGRQAFAFIEVKLLLAAPAPLLRLGYGRDELSPATPVDQMPGRLPRLVEFPMLMRVLVRRIDDRMVEKWVRHSIVGKVTARPVEF